MNINGISMRFCGDLNVSRCKGKGGRTRLFSDEKRGGKRRDGGRRMEVVLIRLKEGMMIKK